MNSYKIHELEDGACFYIKAIMNNKTYDHITYGTGGRYLGANVALYDGGEFITKISQVSKRSDIEWEIRLATLQEKEYLNSCILKGKIILPIPNFFLEFSPINDNYELI